MLFEDREELPCSALEIQKQPIEVASSVSASEASEAGTEVPRGKNAITDWFASFKPLPVTWTPDSSMTPSQRAIAGTVNLPLKRRLTNRHLQLIALGGAIGSGLFIASGMALYRAGPAGLLIAYVLIGLLVFATMNTLGELAVRYPVAGVFSAYNSRFIDRSWGFALGWNYAVGGLTTIPSELCSAAIALSFWDYDDNGATNVNKAAWVSLFYAAIVLINLFGVRGYGEAESIFSVIKALAVIGFCITGIVIACGGAPNHEYLGGKYWHHPGAFSHGVKGVCQVFVTAAYAFSGTELAGLAAAETRNPRESIPKAVRQVTWRIVLFYLVSVIVIGCIVPWTDPELREANGASASPFVVAIRNAKIHALPSILNVVVILSVISVGNAMVYGTSRVLVSLAAQGHAPRILMSLDREGRPVYCMAITLIFGLLCFFSATSKYGEVFTWLSSLGGVSGVIAWGSINVCHLRNRLAMRSQGLSTKDLDFVAPFGLFLPLLGVVLAIAVLAVQFWTAIFPLGGQDMSPAERTESFFETWLGLLIILSFFIGHKLWTRDWMPVMQAEIDLDTGVRILDRDELRQEIAAERAAQRTCPWYVKTFNYWC